MYALHCLAISDDKGVQHRLRGVVVTPTMLIVAVAIVIKRPVLAIILRFC